ncbi:hypothetical protein A2856_00790 [Candidatus Uhrbacteria bacterium RIFCSPHIGHO2_01_FULL_63_20]|uniref:Uncharacterized protein n=1 Tax=Candidatus Uhrbacteria bacterium RIFCSPHIGHO2_01_FULL_63_20 TaxID=1802385 RepID=A0A1F7TM04_9BACT|nr:MAG: hypothetical protein A2856_00790 [Candidatus Uhrbacteria bacterium RIFCSPHIGHO2_01_FULL_63_20]
MTDLKKLAGRAVGLAAAAQTFALAKFVHAQALTGEDLFGGQGQEFGSAAGLGTGDLTTTIAAIIRTALGFLGVIAVVITLYGGFLWMTSAGNDDKVKQAKKIMISGVIGLVIILSAFALASFVITQISTATAG